MRTSTIAAILAPLAAILWLASPAVAHGNMKHVLGTVSAIDGEHVVVKTKDGQSESIVRDAGTKYFRGDRSLLVIYENFDRGAISVKCGAAAGCAS